MRLPGRTRVLRAGWLALRGGAGVCGARTSGSPPGHGGGPRPPTNGPLDRGRRQPGSRHAPRAPRAAGCPAKKSLAAALGALGGRWVPTGRWVKRAGRGQRGQNGAPCGRRDSLAGRWVGRWVTQRALGWPIGAGGRRPSLRAPSSPPLPPSPSLPSLLLLPSLPRRPTGRARPGKFWGVLGGGTRRWVGRTGAGYPLGRWVGAGWRPSRGRRRSPVRTRPAASAGPGPAL